MEKKTSNLFLFYLNACCLNSSLLSSSVQQVKELKSYQKKIK